MIDTYDVGAAKRLERRDWRAIKLMPIILAGSVVQTFGFSFHFRANVSGLWFFIGLGLVPLTVYAASRWAEARWHSAIVRYIGSLAVFVETVGAILSALVLIFYGVVALMGVTS